MKKLIMCCALAGALFAACSGGKKIPENLNSAETLDGVWKSDSMTYTFKGDTLIIDDAIEGTYYRLKRLPKNKLSMLQMTPFENQDDPDTVTVLDASNGILELYYDSDGDEMTLQRSDD